MTNIKTLLALIAGAILLSFTACDVESPGDDDDDDDTTVEFAATIEAETDLPANIEIANGVTVADCPDSTTCTANVTHADTYDVTVDAWNAHFDAKQVQIDEHGDFETVEWTYFFSEDTDYTEWYTEWFLTPNGIYDAYEVECDSKDTAEALETDLEIVTEDKGTYVILHIDDAGYYIFGDYVTNHGLTVEGAVDWSLNQIHLSAPGGDLWYCLQ